MAVADIITKHIGRELLEWLYLGIRTGMRRGVDAYRKNLAAGKVAEAEAQLKRAVDLPNRARARMTLAQTTYGVPRITAVITAANPNVTLAQVNAAVTTLETYAQGLVAHRNADGWTWDQIANDIEANIALEETEWLFPLPAGYLDVWGE